MVKINVYNIKGQRVKALISENKKAGRYKIFWNGTDDKGRKTGSGLYFIRIEKAKLSKVHKIMLLK